MSGRKSPAFMTWAKVHGHKKFDPPTRYYDPEKEEFDSRVKDAKKKYADDTPDNIEKKIRFEKELKKSWGDSKKISEPFGANMSMIIILVAIAVLFLPHL